MKIISESIKIELDNDELKAIITSLKHFVWQIAENSRNIELFNESAKNEVHILYVINPTHKEDMESVYSFLNDALKTKN